MNTISKIVGVAVLAIIAIFVLGLLFALPVMWLWTIWKLFVLEVVVRLVSGEWGSMDYLGFCIGLIAFFVTVRIRQKL